MVGSLLQRKQKGCSFQNALALSVQSILKVECFRLRWSESLKRKHRFSKKKALHWSSQMSKSRINAYLSCDSPCSDSAAHSFWVCFHFFILISDDLRSTKHMPKHSMRRGAAFGSTCSAAHLPFWLQYSYLWNPAKFLSSLSQTFIYILYFVFMRKSSQPQTGIHCTLSLHPDRCSYVMLPVFFCAAKCCPFNTLNYTIVW